MVETRTRRASKLTAIILSLMMVVVFMPTFAFAAEADGITVYLTVSEQGTLAKAKDGSAMAWKEVTVKDTDADGNYSFAEALVAAHETYCPDGAEGFNNSGDTVTKIWGKETYNCLFADNNSMLKSGVATDKVSNGDFLAVSVNKDEILYSDRMAYFDQNEKTVGQGQSFTLKLEGHTDGTLADKSNPIPGAEVGVWKDGTIEAMATTGDNGEATLKFNETGTYVISASGSVQSTVLADDSDEGIWYLIKSGRDKDGKTIYGHMDYTTYETGIAYTEKDYGEGPYPFSEIKYVDMGDFDADEWDTETDGYLLYSGIVINDCPIVAPACVVTVNEVTPADPADVTITVNNKGSFAAAKDGSAMVEKDVTVNDIDNDGHLTFNEALIAAHKTYFEGGAEGYATGDPYGYGLAVTKLWGVETSNTLFYTNGQGLATGVMDDEVKAGDNLYASVNADDTYYADWYTSFANTKETVATPAPISSADFYATFDVEINGHYGMGYTPEQLKDVPLEGLQIGIWEDGVFKPIEGAVTDANGKATVKIKNPDDETYLLTATGTVKYEVQDWSAGGAMKEVDCPIMAPYEFVEVEYKLASKVDEQKAEAIKDLVASCDLSEYKAAEQIKALAIIVKAQADLSSANTTSAIESILAAAKEEIAALKTAAQYTEEAKAKVAATQVKGVKAKAGAKKATVSWTKNSVFSGYQIYYKVKGTSKWKSTTATGKSKVIKSLKKGKRYQFKVRGYKAFDGKKTYGKWSVVKTIKIK